MSEKKLEEEQQDEAASVTGGSMTGDIRGVQMPLGAQGKKKKNNPSKPFGESELKEVLAALAEELEYETIDIDETVVDQPDGSHTVVDPTTGAQLGTFTDRESARELNRQKGFAGATPGQPSSASGGTVAPQTAASSKSSAPQKRGVDPITGKAKTGTKQKKKTSKPSAGGMQLAAGKNYFRKTLKEAGLALVPIEESFMFEDGKESMWESFVGNLSDDYVASDMGLSEVLKAMAVAEARTLARSVMEIKKVLEGSGRFMVERKKADQCPESGATRMPFTVSLGEGVEPLLFAVKLEGAKPSILFPESSRNVLNNMLTKESKLLRAELMHMQETVLDKFEEVIEAAQRRDTYLESVHGRLREFLGGMSLVETAIMKNLVREKLKGAR